MRRWFSIILIIIKQTPKKFYLYKINFSVCFLLCFAYLYDSNCDCMWMWPCLFRLSLILLLPFICYFSFSFVSQILYISFLLCQYFIACNWVLCMHKSLCNIKESFGDVICVTHCQTKQQIITPNNVLSMSIPLDYKIVRNSFFSSFFCLPILLFRWLVI